jgi:alcohol dehydrogenase, propanol-preferring
VRAVQLVAWQAEPELRDVAVPEPGVGQVLLQVTASGLCHSDLHVMDWPEGRMPWPLPFTLGHETAGTVAAVGSGVDAVEVGQPVVVFASWGCGMCLQCLQGAENRCPERPVRKNGGGMGRDGGFAEYLLVPSPRLLVPSDGLDPVHAAPLTDAALTPYHAIKESLWRLVPGSTTVVIGVGGLGHVAVQLLRLISPTRIVALDARAEAVQLALDAGADAAFVSGEIGIDELRAELGAGGATLVLDFVGVDATLQLGASLLGSGGHVTLIGVGGGSFPMAFGRLPLEWSLSRISNGTIPELHEVVALARRGDVSIEVEQIGLEDVVATYSRLREGAVVGRAVAVP